MEQGLVHDASDWWDNGLDGAALPVRYQISVNEPVVAVRMETQMKDQPGTYALQVLLDAAGCRLLGEHLLQTAELLEAKRKPMN